MIARVVIFAFVVGCGGTVQTSSDGGADASTDAKPFKDAAADVIEPTITFTGTTVVSPNGTALAQVMVCVFEHAELPCTTTDAAGNFSIGMPMNTETALTFSLTAYASVLIPFETTTADIGGYTIGIPTAAARTSMYAAFGVTFPDSTNGFVMLDGTLQGQNELGLDGATGSLLPQSGTGPYYLDASGTAAPAATSTSTYSLVFFAGVTPATYVGTLAPLTMSCFENFGGWSASQKDSTRFPVSAGFETHVGLDCHK